MPNATKQGCPSQVVSQIWHVFEKACGEGKDKSGGGLVLPIMYHAERSGLMWRGVDTSEEWQRLMGNHLRLAGHKNDGTEWEEAT
eukprot:2584109-Amphidinium_carterae.1